MGGPDTIGWIASAILIATLSRQIFNQWQHPDEKGVSTWLFIGQTAASIGFIVYSALLVNWVFIVTNSLILLTALVGQAVVWRNKRRQHAARVSTDRPGG